jgi:hypothetical protein
LIRFTPIRHTPFRTTHEPYNVHADSFIAGLPYGKNPDRKDFIDLSNKDREVYWNTVLEATNQLVEDLHAALEKDGARSAVMPIESIL